jgi:5-methyltetrahydropteroyltriglutamate--homocysteine methyltransferase
VTQGARNKPPFRADHVGSFLRPRRLFEARKRWHENALAKSELRRIEDECIRGVVAMQEEVGLKGITDGDFRRDDWFLDFMFSMDGIERSQENFTAPFSGGLVFKGPLVKMTGKLRCPPGGIMVDDFKFLQSTTRRTAKLAIPAPAMFYSVIDPATTDKAVYPDLREFWNDLGRAYSDAIGHFAQAGCTYLQIDDVNSANIADSRWQSFWQGRGYNSELLVDAFINANNAAVANRPKDLSVLTHMCRGNYQSQWAAEGSYDMIAERYFNRSAVDGFFLEFDDPRSGGFEPLRFMPRDKMVVLGVMTSKTPQLESKDELKRRIEAAAKYVPLERLCISPQCGFASTQEGNKLTEDEQRRKLARLVEVAEEVWGGV